MLKPFDKGGWGAIQLNARVDYLDLSDRVGTEHVPHRSARIAPFYVNGGKQLGYQPSVIWNPIDYLRFMAQYGHVDITGGPRAATVEPTQTPADKRKFDADTRRLRAQLEF